MNKGQDDKVGNTSDAPATAMVGMRSFAIRDDASLAMNRMISPDSDTTAASTARTMKPAAAWTRLPSSTHSQSHVGFRHNPGQPRDGSLGGLCTYGRLLEGSCTAPLENMTPLNTLIALVTALPTRSSREL